MSAPRSARSHVFRWLSLLGLALGCLVAVPASASADGQGQPFDCKVSTIYVAQGNPTQLSALAYGSGGSSFVPVGGPSDGPYNAIGFNPVDKYIYGVSAGGSLIKIDSAGVVSYLGYFGQENALNVGAFDPAGSFYTMQGNTSTLYKVDVGAVASTPIALSAVPGVADLTWINGKLWGESAGGPSDGGVIPASLVRVDPATGTVDSFPTTEIPATTGAGAAWTYGNGSLGLSDNNTGTVYQIAIGFPNSDSPTFHLVAANPGPAAQNNDGTSCVGPPADLSITKTGPARVNPGATITWEIRVHNGGPGTSSGYVVHDNVPTGVTNVHTIPVTQPSCTVAANNNVNCIGGPLGPGDDAIITIQGTAPQATGASIDNTATVDGNDADPNLLNNTATAPGRVFLPVPFCRGTALNALGLHGGDANPAEVPCTNDTDTELKVHVGAPSVLPALTQIVDASVLAGATGIGPFAQTGEATADVANVTVNLLNIIKIQAQALHSEAGATFSGTCGLANLAAKSHVAAIAINGKGFTIGDAPVTIPLGIATIYINQTVVTPGSIIQRALFIDLPGTLLDVVVSESKAGVGCI